MFSWSRTQSTPDGPRQPTPQPRPAEPVAAPAATPAKPAEVEAPAPARRFTDAVPPCATRLGGLQIRGTLAGSDSVELSGTFDGPITVEGLCHVLEGGRVTGDVTAGDAVIDGEVKGRLSVVRRLEMSSHARVLADVEAGTIAIAEGCFIEGRIHMRGSSGGSQPVTFTEKRRGKKRRGHGPKANPSAAPAVGSPPASKPPALSTEPPEGSSET